MARPKDADPEQTRATLLDAAEEDWAEVSPAGELPSPRSGHDSVWLPEASSLFVFGGRGENGDLDDLWRLFVPLGA